MDVWVELNGRKRGGEHEELLGLGPVSLMIGGSGLRWFGRVGRGDDSD